MSRINFHEELQTAESGLIAEGTLVRKQLSRVMSALERRDTEIATQVIAEDDRVDDVYLATQSRILNLLALQAPVAGDLRLVSAILHSNMHVERMGDLCVNIAKFVLNRLPYPPESPMLSRLGDMGVRADEMLGIALTAFAERNLELAEELPDKDDALDRLNRGMLSDLKQFAGEEQAFEWATNLLLVARYLERFGDHVVDLGEQISFLITGVFREFTDASHPDQIKSYEVATEHRDAPTQGPRDGEETREHNRDTLEKLDRVDHSQSEPPDEEAPPAGPSVGDVFRSGS